MSESLQNTGHALRSLRMAKAMSQETLALAAGISRTTLIQIEKGKDAQVSNMEAVARVLGVEFGIVSESPQLALRRQARAELQSKQTASREKHLKIAVQLALGGPEAKALKQGALRMVALWQERELCSPTYIAQWQQILDADPRQVAKNILSMDEAWGPALRQNTPFAVSLP